MGKASSASPEKVLHEKWMRKTKKKRKKAGKGVASCLDCSGKVRVEEMRHLLLCLPPPKKKRKKNLLYSSAW